MARIFEPFLSTTKGVCILDGGLGTELETHTSSMNSDLWSATLLTTTEGKALVKKAHKAFYSAGADVGTTATYQASVEGYSAQGFSAEESQGFMRAAVEVADEARREVWEEVVGSGNPMRRLRPLVAVSLGCYGAFLADGSEFTGDYRSSRTVKQLQEFHQQRLEVFKEVEDLFEVYAFETVPCGAEVEAILEALKACGSQKAAWISVSLKDDAHLCSGELLEDVVKMLIRETHSSVAGIGINCSKPEIVEDALTRVKGLVKDAFHLVVYPNSGEAWNMEKKEWIPGTHPSHERFVSLARRWKKAGASAIGGCCRITPDFIHALSCGINHDVQESDVSFSMLALGPNPAYQKLTTIQELKLNEVNRVQELKVIGNDYGQNFARAACSVQQGCCGVAHFLGGHTGKWISSQLSDQGVAQLTSWTKSKTRTCTTLKDLSSKTVTEIIDPSGKVTVKEYEELVGQIRDILPTLKALAFCGTTPPGSEGLYSSIAISKPPGCMLLVDSFKSVRALMDTEMIDVLKLAKYELSALLGEDIQFPKGAIKFFKKYPTVEWLAVTDGPNTAYLCEATRYWMYKIPSIEDLAVINPIGAGDTCGGVFLAKHVLMGASMDEAFRWGLAAATAKCYVEDGGGIYKQSKCEECYKQIVVSENSM